MLCVGFARLYQTKPARVGGFFIAHLPAVTAKKAGWTQIAQTAAQAAAAIRANLS